MEKGTTVHFLRGATADLNAILKEKIAEEKAKIFGKAYNQN
jgi:hypothetical protein